jgi:hypothetical protein
MIPFLVAILLSASPPSAAELPDFATAYRFEQFHATAVGAQWELPGGLARRNHRKKPVREVLDFVE